MNSHIRPDPKHLVFYFHVHQPRRLKKFGFFEIGSAVDYFDDDLDEQIVHRIAAQCYLPVNRMLLNLIQSNPAIRISFSISGTALEQFERYAPNVIDSFRDLARTGSVEFLTETSYHSLASMLSGDEFELQVMEHTEKIKTLFGITPVLFRNTGLIHSDEIGKRVYEMGFAGILSEGSEAILKGRSPHRVYHHPDEMGLKLLLRSTRLSEELAFRFQEGENNLTLDQYMGWLRGLSEHERVIVVGMDYQVFGEYYTVDTGIQSFLESLLMRIASDKGFRFSFPSDVVRTNTSTIPIAVPSTTSWADKDKDITAWLGNDMQAEAFKTVAELETEVKKIHNTSLLTTWRHLLTSDHFYYMATKSDDDARVHAHFSHYKSPYEAFINYFNVLSDFAVKVKNASPDDTEMAKQQEIERRTHLAPAWVEERAAAYKYEGSMGEK